MTATKTAASVTSPGKLIIQTKLTLAEILPMFDYEVISMQPDRAGRKGGQLTLELRLDHEVVAFGWSYHGDGAGFNLANRKSERCDLLLTFEKHLPRILGMLDDRDILSATLHGVVLPRRYRRGVHYFSEDKFDGVTVTATSICWSYSLEELGLAELPGKPPCWVLSLDGHYRRKEHIQTLLDIRDKCLHSMELATPYMGP